MGKTRGMELFSPIEKLVVDQGQIHTGGAVLTSSAWLALFCSGPKLTLFFGIPENENVESKNMPFTVLG
jgi:hypothetical protein